MATTDAQKADAVKQLVTAVEQRQGAPLTARQRQIIDSTITKFNMFPGALGTLAIAGGGAALLGHVAGSEHPIRNFALGSLAGFTFNFVAAMLIAKSALDELSEARPLPAHPQAPTMPATRGWWPDEHHQAWEHEHHRHHDAW